MSATAKLARHKSLHHAIPLEDIERTCIFQSLEELYKWDEQIEDEICARYSGADMHIRLEHIERISNAQFKLLNS